MRKRAFCIAKWWLCIDSTALQVDGLLLRVVGMDLELLTNLYGVSRRSETDVP